MPHHCTNPTCNHLDASVYGPGGKWLCTACYYGDWMRFNEIVRLKQSLDRDIQTQSGRFRLSRWIDLFKEFLGCSIYHAAFNLGLLNSSHTDWDTHAFVVEHEPLLMHQIIQTFCQVQRKLSVSKVAGKPVSLLSFHYGSLLQSALNARELPRLVESILSRHYHVESIFDYDKQIDALYKDVLISVHADDKPVIPNPYSLFVCHCSHCESRVRHIGPESL